METLLTILIPALIAVESGGDCNAVGDGGLAVGILQIHPICVYDVNRILCEEKYTLKDRLDPIKAKEMCKIYLTHYGRFYEYTSKKKVTLEILARNWNGNPVYGYQKESTEKYWMKVKRVINQRAGVKE